MGPRRTTIIRGQPSWRVAGAGVEAYVTRQGGHLGPVRHRFRGRVIQPYAIAPWAQERLEPATDPVLRPLRGDFFCLPFGGNAAPWRAERHPAHGETATARWSFQSLTRTGDASCLHLRLRTTVRPGRVDKRLWVVDGHPAVYQQHLITGLAGPISLGHHAMLQFPDQPGSGRVSTSRFVHGQVSPRPLERPEDGGYSLLKPGAAFSSLARVATITGEPADLSRYPARRGFDDLALLVADDALPFAWTAVAFPQQRYVWLALKDPRVLRATVFWFSNGGRHRPPWNGRHRNVMGLEDVTAYFHYGLAESVRPNPLANRGFPTCVRLWADRPLAVNYILATVGVPAGFDRVASVRAGAGGRSMAIRAANGLAVTVPLDVRFLHTGAIRAGCG